MPNYRRSHIPGGTWFFTVVTYNRAPVFNSPEYRLALRQSIIRTRTVLPFSIHAWVLLPDHMHCIWSLPENDHNYSKRWGMIKAGFSKIAGAKISETNHSRYQHRETMLWQRRFWEHLIQDEQDYQSHMDYIHYNPVKHGYVANVIDWPYSSFHRHIENDTYPHDWGKWYNDSAISIAGE